MYPVLGTVDQLVGLSVRNYHITRLLGQGNLSVVYLAEQYSQSQPIMLTLFMLSPTYDDLAREHFFARFSQVARGLTHLNHPAILSTIDFGEYTGYPFIVTPYVEEVSLASVLKQQGRCTPEQTLGLLRQIASGLDHAHEQGLIHGTLRAANVLLANGQTIHMTGFGLAQMLGMRGVSSTRRSEAHLLNIGGTFLYSPEYLAPEVVLGAPLSAQTDVYALGVLIFELLTGRLPFTGRDPFAVAALHLSQPIPSLLDLCPDLPAGLDLVLQRALERNPAERYQSASRLATAFARVLGVLEAAAKPLLVGSSPKDILGATMPPTSDWLYSELVPDGGPSEPMLDFAAGWQNQPLAIADPPGSVHISASRSQLQSVPQPSLNALPETPSDLSAGTTRLRLPHKLISRRTALLVTGGVVATGALVGVGISLSHLFLPRGQASKGTIIGKQDLAANSAQAFTNSIDKRESLLIHLPDKHFVAYESVCTHENVPLHYDAVTHMLVCPKHSSKFDPSRNGAVVKGPATKALPAVSIHINADGTISTG